MGDGTKENPFTREDVLKAIEKNGGKARGLDLSGKVFEKGIDLSDLPLCEIILNDTQLIHANFNGSDLDGAIMQRANLQYATFNPFKLKDNTLKNASLAKVDLRGAYLKNAEFREADLSGAQLQKDPEKSPKKPLCANLEETDFRNAYTALH